MDWRMQGSAQRRRMSAPSNHYGAAMAIPRSNDPSMDEALAGMARVGNPRMPMGMSAYTLSAPVPPERGTLMPKGHSKSVDPTVMNAGPGTRTFGPYDRNGAHYGVSVMCCALVDPAAGATQANAKIVPSVAMRSAPNFYMGMQASQEQ